MSIHLIAKDLYRLIREVESLEKKLEKTPLEKRYAVERDLAKACAERDHVRKILDGRKEG